MCERESFSERHQKAEGRESATERQIRRQTRGPRGGRVNRAWIVREAHRRHPRPCSQTYPAGWSCRSRLTRSLPPLLPKDSLAKSRDDVLRADQPVAGTVDAGIHGVCVLIAQRSQRLRADGPIRFSRTAFVVIDWAACVAVVRL